jgi:hypothetical protein
MSDKASDTSIRVISQGYNFWKVQVLFNDAKITSGEIPERLRQVKTELALQFGVPDSLLEYVQLLSKKKTRNGVLVEMQIVKHALPIGAPRFRSSPMKGTDGTIFADMVIEADFYPLDEFEKPLTHQTIRERLQQQGYEPTLVQWDVVDQALQQLDLEGRALLSLKIAEGTLPEFGKNSIITYGVSSDEERLLPSAWIGVRPVGRGDFLVEALPAVHGLRRGINLRGRELEARTGINTTVEIGEGSRHSMRETKLIAAREGIVVFERHGRDRRQKDQREAIPSRLVAKVLPHITFTESKVYELDLFDAAQIIGTVRSGSKIHSSQPLYIEGDVEAGTEIECDDSIRIVGNVHKADISCKCHIAVSGKVMDSVVEAGLTLQVEGSVSNSTVYAMNIIADEIEGGYVEVLSQTKIASLKQTGQTAAAIHVNLQKFLERQQVEGKQAIEDLQDSLARLIDIFGSDVALHSNESTIQRLLLKWLRDQKAAGVPPYTYAEVKEFRTLLELVPQIREQLTAIGMELREVTAKLHSEKRADNLEPSTPPLSQKSVSE